MDRARPGRRRSSTGEEEGLREGRADRAVCAAGGRRSARWGGKEGGRGEGAAGARIMESPGAARARPQLSGPPLLQPAPSAPLWLAPSSRDTRLDCLRPTGLPRWLAADLPRLPRNFTRVHVRFRPRRTRSHFLPASL
ncbi:hypothetical protein NN561_020281 [Cricetulus griseus]